uniref:Reverse transcriptase domain-containing protein n=1 Tax=Fagus sylvatica TaxID=28930 RepID=A0A2N9GUX3_FAGSY
MEGANNDRTSTDPPMTPIERQMQVIATSIQELARETTCQNKELCSQRRGRPPTHLLNVKQVEGESLRTYVHRFNKEALQIDCPKEDITLTTFVAGLQKGDFLYDLCKNSPETLSELMYEAQKHMNAEDTIESRDDPPLKRRKDADDRTGRDTHSTGKIAEVHNILVIQQPPKNIRLDDQIISFSEEDARGTHRPHNDALVITMNIDGFPTRRLMVDNGSLVDILYLTAYQQMKFDKGKLQPMEAPLVGFTGDKVKKSIVQFLRENKDIFAWSHEDMPVKQKRRVFAPERNNAIMEEVDKLLAANFIREVFYPDGYNQIVMNKNDQEKTSFIMGRRLFCNKVMPFGLKNVKATYQRLMNRMLHDQIGRNFEVYVDDMLVKSKEEGGHLDDLEETLKTLCKYQMKLNPSKNFEVYVDDMLVKSKEEGGHLDDLEEALKTLRKYQMKLNPRKCAFGVSSGKFLGFMVSQRGIQAKPNKIKAILDMQPLRTTKEAQGLTGRVAALNHFVSQSTDKCLPFFKTLKKAFEWMEECRHREKFTTT